jgi:hypothetical protein
LPKGNKKQRHKAKRQEKRREARRRESISPLKRLADSPGEIECWMSRDFEGNGQLQIFVLKQAAGLSGVACFLVDRGVVGLKDAWTRMRIDRKDFKGMLDACVHQGIPMSRVALDDVRRAVAGGLRWAYENGMRLPKDWTKTASLIGGVGEWMSADVSKFVMEFAGHPEDLRQRLITEPFDNYLRRTDIHFVFSDAAPYLDQETGEYSHPAESDLDEKDDPESIADELPEDEINALAARLTPSTAMLAKETAAWLAARDQTPSPELPEAWQSIMLASLLSKSAMPDAPEEEVADVGFDLLQELSSRIDESRSAEHHKAVGQALEYLHTDPKMMQNAVLKYGLAGEPADEN